MNASIAAMAMSSPWKEGTGFADSAGAGAFGATGAFGAAGALAAASPPAWLFCASAFPSEQPPSHRAPARIIGRAILWACRAIIESPPCWDLAAKGNARQMLGQRLGPLFPGFRDSGGAQPQRGQLAPNLALPVPVGPGIGGARVEDLPDPNGPSGQAILGAPRREGADADHPLGFEDPGEVEQEAIAGRKEGLAFARRQLVGGAVAAAFFHEDQGAVIGDEVLLEKTLRSPKMRGHRAPEPRPAHFAPRAGKALDRALGIDSGGLGHRCLDAQPVPNPAHLAEGDAGLRHAEGAGIHAEEDHAPPPGRVAPEVGVVGTLGVLDGVVDVAYGRA